jgi:hypothetical protein
MQAKAVQLRRARQRAEHHQSRQQSILRKQPGVRGCGGSGFWGMEGADGRYGLMDGGGRIYG